MSDLLPWMAPYSGWAVMALLFVAGMLTVAAGLRGRRPKRRDDRCSHCGYSRVGAPTTICSECGSDCSSNVLPRRRVSFRLMLIGVVIALGLPAFVIQMRVRQFGADYYLRVGPGYWLWPEEVIDSVRSGNNQLVLLENRRRYCTGGWQYEASCEFRSGRTVLWRSTDDCFTFGLDPIFASGVSTLSDLPPLADIDNDGRDDFIVTAKSGGNSGAVGVTLISPSADGRDARIIEAVNLSGAGDLDGDGTVEFSAVDHSYVFFNTCHAASCYPSFVYRLKDDVLVVDPALTAETYPVDERAIAAFGEQCAAVEWSPRVEDALFSPLLHAMLSLTYAGRADEAMRFLDEVWPGPESAKLEFLIELRARAACSDAGPIVQPLIAAIDLRRSAAGAR